MPMTAAAAAPSEASVLGVLSCGIFRLICRWLGDSGSSEQTGWCESATNGTKAIDMRRASLDAGDIAIDSIPWRALFATHIIYGYISLYLSLYLSRSIAIPFVPCRRAQKCYTTQHFAGVHTIFKLNACHSTATWCDRRPLAPLIGYVSCVGGAIATAQV